MLFIWLNCDSAPLSSPKGRVILDKDGVLPTGTLRAFSFHACRAVPFSVQVWRQEEDKEGYKLIWQKAIGVDDIGEADAGKTFVSIPLLTI